jgi:hypothetical protein
MLLDKMKEAKKRNDAEGLNDSAIFKQKLKSGGFGLKRIFWLYWIIPIIGLEILDYLLGSNQHASVIAEASMLYLSGYIFLCIRNTSGSKIWKIAALTVIFLYFILSVLALIASYIYQ